MITYIFKSSLSLILLFGLYWFMLRKEKLFVFNRYFLIFSILLSLIIPFIEIPVNVRTTTIQSSLITSLNNNLQSLIPEENQVNMIKNQPISNAGGSVEAIPSGINLSQILMILYFTGLIIMLSRFLLNFFYISRQKRMSETITRLGQKLALVDHQIKPFSFLKTIFVSKHDYLNNKITKDILAHEIEHVRQFHSIDIIFIELLQIIYWFNPILLLFNWAIRINHEYMSDNAAIRESTDIKNYADTLVSFISFGSSIPMTSGFNPSFYKRRLVMMTKNSSSNIINMIRISATLGLVTVICFTLSCMPSNSQTFKTGKDIDVVQGMSDFSGKWVLNRSQGKTFLTEVASSTLIISQDKNSITFDITISPDNYKPVYRTEKYVYNTSIEKKNTQKDKLTVITCTPSQDGGSFSITETLSYTQNGIEKVIKRVSVYSLGKDGKTLIINQEDIPSEASNTPENERYETRIYDKLN